MVNGCRDDLSETFTIKVAKVLNYTEIKEVNLQNYVYAVCTLFYVMEFESCNRAFNLLFSEFFRLSSIPNIWIFKFRMCPLNDRDETLTASEAHSLVTPG